MQNVFQGLGIALITPFKKDRTIDFTALERLIEYQLDGGADFFCILATTSENPCLTHQEKDEITRFIIARVAGRAPILRYCGGNNTAAVVEEIKTTHWSGIDGILSISPYYNKPSQDGICAHFRAIAQAAPLPVVLYNVPGRTGVNMTAQTTLRIAAECPNIIAIKEASGNADQANEIIRSKPHHFQVISGDDALTLPLIASGAAGVISVIGNALPKQFATMVHLALNGDMAPARKIHNSLADLYKLLFVDGNPSGCKALLSEMGMIENILRLPLTPVRAATQEKIRNMLAELNLA